MMRWEDFCIYVSQYTSQGLTSFHVLLIKALPQILPWVDVHLQVFSHVGGLAL